MVEGARGLRAPRTAGVWRPGGRGDVHRRRRLRLLVHLLRVGCVREPQALEDCRGSSKAGTCRVSGKTAPIRRRRYLPERGTGHWGSAPRSLANLPRHLGELEEVRGVSRIRWAAYCIGFPVSLICLVTLVAGCGSNTTTTKQAAATPPPEPSVELHLNQGSFSQTGSQATLTGTVTPGAAVTVSEHPAAIHGSDWHATVQHLHVGESTIGVSASLTGHQSAEDTITVTRHHTQAELEAIAQATKEREARRKEREEQREREERAHKKSKTKNKRSRRRHPVSAECVAVR